MRSSFHACGDSFSGLQQHISVEEEKNTLDEGKLMLLAERFFLSPIIVKEAWDVFRRYCVLDERLQLQSARLIGTHSSLESQTTTGISSMQRKTESAIGASPQENSELNGDQEAMGMEVEESPDGKIECVDVVEASAEPKSSEGTNPSGHCEQLQEKEKVVLGVGGLQQFFHDMGILMPSLEVLDLVHGLHDDPVDYVLHQRSAAEEAALPALGPSLSRPDASGRLRSQDRSATPPKTRENRRSGSVGRKKATANAIPNGFSNEAITAQRSLNKHSRDGVTFPLFLFILSNLRLESGDIEGVKKREVGDLFRAIDVNGDGVISVEDVQKAVQRLKNENLLANDREIARLCAMSSIELDAALSECDVDGDGCVTLEDLVLALHS